MSHVAPHPETKGVYGGAGTIADYIATQDALAYMQATDEYATWLRRAYDVLEAADEDADDDSSADDLLDMDAVIAARRRETGIEEPLDIEARKALHLRILAERLVEIDGGA